MDIRARRQAAGLTQAQLAHRARVPRLNLSAYENSRRAPSRAVLERITRALEVPVSTGSTLTATRSSRP